MVFSSPESLAYCVIWCQLAGRGYLQPLQPCAKHVSSTFETCKVVVQEVNLPGQQEAVPAVGVCPWRRAVQAPQESWQVLIGSSTLLCCQHFPGLRQAAPARLCVQVKSIHAGFVTHGPLSHRPLTWIILQTCGHYTTAKAQATM